MSSLDAGYEKSSLEEIEDVLDDLGTPTSQQVYLGTLGQSARSLAAVAASVAQAGGGGALTEQDVQDLIDASIAELGGGQFPISALVLAHHTPAAQTNFDNVIGPVSQTDGSIGVGYVTSDNSDGASIEFLVALAAGEYDFLVGHWPHAGAGILRFALDDGGGFDDIDDPPYSASAATLDSYAASGAVAVARVATGLTIPTSGVYTLRALVNGKNGSSSGFATNLRFMSLQATSLA